ncbi:MAG: serine hydrolase domain-containing protein [Agriterribacter sp.]
MKKIYLFFYCLLLWKISVAQIIRIDEATATQISNTIQTRFGQSNLTGLSVGVIYGGELAYANAWGKAKNNGTPFSIQTKTVIGSVSKIITAIMAMRMIEDGNLGLDVTIGHYLDEYDGSNITIRHLLCHQSGIPHYNSCSGGYNGQFDWEESVDAVTDCEVCGTPGGQMLYTTFGVTLLGAIIEKRGLEIYNRNYRQLYNDWVRSPGGLTNLTPEYDDSEAALADGYNETGVVQSRGWDDIGWRLPAGGFVSDIVDLTSFGAGILRNRFISQQSFNLMQVIQMPSGAGGMPCANEKYNDGTFGLGFGIQTSGVSQILFHSGLNDHGYTSYLFLYPEAGAGIIFLCNTYDYTNSNNILNVLSAMQNAVINVVRDCPATRNFTNAVTWNSPLYYEASNITISAPATHASGNLVFDAGNSVSLLPGFEITATQQRTFHAFIEGCGRDNRPF